MFQSLLHFFLDPCADKGCATETGNEQCIDDGNNDCVCVAFYHIIAGDSKCVGEYIYVSFDLGLDTRQGPGVLI